MTSTTEKRLDSSEPTFTGVGLNGLDNDLLLKLQGFRIDLFGDRYEPYEVISQEFLKTAAERERITRTIDLARKLSAIIDSQFDRKLIISSNEWPDRTIEPIRLPERMIYNSLKLAGLLAYPAILGKPLRMLYDREQSQPLLRSSSRSALLDALQSNQRCDEYNLIWHQILQQGHTSNGYFVSNPQFGRQGILRSDLNELTRTFDLLDENASLLEKRQVAEAIRWHGQIMGPMPSKMKPAFVALLDRLLTRNPPAEKVSLAIQLAELGNWPDWMVRRLPPIATSKLNETFSRWWLKDEIYLCLSKRDLGEAEYLCRKQFAQVSVIGRDESLIAEVYRLGNSFKQTLAENNELSESAERGAIVDWLTGIEKGVSDRVVFQRISDEIDKEMNYWTNQKLGA
jgi:hypothetical protein